jgi:2-polyprenyl-3-methyl-5-hydroxy-6-metoxy-1,4-benzoquinol methylase
MSDQATDLLEKIRQQFDSAPYPCAPVEDSPENDIGKLFLNSLVTPYYLKNQRFVNTQGKTILDAGCGSGFKALTLAIANPGAKIVGVDLSGESIELAKQRFQFHSIENAEFHVLSIDDLPRLKQTFDYINCDDVLYFFPNLEAGLRSIKSVLNPEGIIRGNLHSATQRFHYLRAQEVFRTMGLMEANPEDLEVEIVRDTMMSIKDEVDLKVRTWSSTFTDPKKGKQKVLANYLLQGDKSYTVSELMSSLRAADLEFISMLDWQSWNLLNLFEQPNELPEFWKKKLPEMSIERRLEIFELLQPNHRLLDFWCTHSGQTSHNILVSDWKDSDWKNAIVHLHPALKTPQFKAELSEALRQQQSFEIGQISSESSQSSLILEADTLAYLLPLWDESQRVDSLVNHWRELRPLNPVTLDSKSEEEAFEQVKQVLTSLSNPLYVLLERST